MTTYHGITGYRCGSCGYVTTDDYTLTVINDLLGACMQCDTEATRSDFDITEGSEANV